MSTFTAAMAALEATWLGAALVDEPLAPEVLVADSEADSDAIVVVLRVVL